MMAGLTHAWQNGDEERVQPKGRAKKEAHKAELELEQGGTNIEAIVWKPWPASPMMAGQPGQEIGTSSSWE